MSKESATVFRGFDSNTLMLISKRIASPGDSLKFAALTPSASGIRNKVFMETRRNLFRRQQLKKLGYDFPDHLLFKDISEDDRKIFLYLVLSFEFASDHKEALTLIFRLLRVEDEKLFFAQPAEDQLKYLSERNPLLFKLCRDKIACFKHMAGDSSSDPVNIETAIKEADSMLTRSYMNKMPAYIKPFFNEKIVRMIGPENTKAYVNFIKIFFKYHNPTKMLRSNDFQRQYFGKAGLFCDQFWRLHRLKRFSVVSAHFVEPEIHPENNYLVRLLCHYPMGYKIIDKYPELLELLNTEEAFLPLKIHQFFERILGCHVEEAYLEYLLSHAPTIDNFIDAFQSHPLTTLNSDSLKNLTNFYDYYELESFRNVEIVLDGIKTNLLETLLKFVSQFQFSNTKISVYHLFVKAHHYLLGAEKLAHFLSAFHPLIYREVKALDKTKPVSQPKVWFLMVPNFFQHESSANVERLYQRLCSENDRELTIQLFKLFENIFSYLGNPRRCWPFFIHIFNNEDNAFIKELIEGDFGKFYSGVLKADFTNVLGLSASLYALLNPLNTNLRTLYEKVHQNKQELFLERLKSVLQTAHGDRATFWLPPLFSGDAEQLVAWILNDDFYCFYHARSKVVPLLLQEYGSDWSQYKYYAEFLAVFSPADPVILNIPPYCDSKYRKLLTFLASFRSAADVRKFIESRAMIMKSNKNFFDFVGSHAFDEICRLAMAYADSDAQHSYSLLELILNNYDTLRAHPINNLIDNKENLFKTFPKKVAPVITRVPNIPPVAPSALRKGLNQGLVQHGTFKLKPVSNDEKLSVCIKFLENVEKSVEPMTPTRTKLLEEAQAILQRMLSSKTDHKRKAEEDDINPTANKAAVNTDPQSTNTTPSDVEMAPPPDIAPHGRR